MQTILEMERYLKDEPKIISYYQLPSNLNDPWDMFSKPLQDGGDGKSQKCIFSESNTDTEKSDDTDDEKYDRGIVIGIHHIVHSIRPAI